MQFPTMAGNSRLRGSDERGAMAGDGGAFYDMDMNTAITSAFDNNFYKRTKIDDHIWNRAMYLYPITDAQVKNIRLLVQNPL